MERQKAALRVIKADSKFSAQTRNKAAAALSKVTSGISALNRILSQNSKAVMSPESFKAALRDVDRTGLAAMHEGDKVIVIVINNPGNGGDGGDGGDTDTPDCSGAYDNIFSACVRGINIKMQCGYYNENGGAPAVEAANDKCMMDANTAKRECESGSNSSIGSQVQAYETGAMLTCAQYESAKSLSNNPPQTSSSNGN